MSAPMQLPQVTSVMSAPNQFPQVTQTLQLGFNAANLEEEKFLDVPIESVLAHSETLSLPEFIEMSTKLVFKVRFRLSINQNRSLISRNF
jgi:hypothetical protein